MRPSSHFNCALGAFGAYYFLYPSTSWIYGTLFLLSSVLIDLDYALIFIFKEKNHRQFITHYLPLWILILILAYIKNALLLFWICLGIVIHLTLDLIDWGLPILPHRSNSYLTPHILKLKVDEIEKLTKQSKEEYFISKYWTNKTIKHLELFFLIFGIIGWIYSPIKMKLVVLIMSVAIYSRSVYEVYQSHKTK